MNRCTGKTSSVNRFQSILLCSIILALFAFIGTGCDYDSSKWDKAKNLNSIESYKTYLNEYPEGKYAEEATKNIEILLLNESWEKAIRGNSIESYYSFIQEYPESEKKGEALSIIHNLAINTAYQKTGANLLSLNQIKAFAKSGVSPKETTAEQKQELLSVLTDMIKQIPREMRVTFSSIQPDPSGNPIIVSDAVKKDSGRNIASSYTLKGSKELADVRSVGGMIFPPGSDGNISNTFIATKGDSVVEDPSKHRKNVTSWCSVRKQTISDTPFFILYTELPEELVPYYMGSGGLFSGPEIVVPNGENSLFRFKGEVIDFYPDLKIYSNMEEPLCLILLKGEGLTYVFGRGKIIDNTGKEYELPYNTAVTPKVSEVSG